MKLYAWQLVIHDAECQIFHIFREGSPVWARFVRESASAIVLGIYRSMISKVLDNLSKRDRKTHQASAGLCIIGYCQIGVLQSINLCQTSNSKTTYNWYEYKASSQVVPLPYTSLVKWHVMSHRSHCSP